MDREELQTKFLYNKGKLWKNTIKIMEAKRSFWDMAVEPIGDLSAEVFPVDFKSFPLGTSVILNQMLWHLQRDTKETFRKVREWAEQNCAQVHKQEEVIETALNVVGEAFRSLELPFTFRQQIERMLRRLFTTGINSSVAFVRFEDFKALFRMLPFAWRDTFHQLLRSDPHGDYKFELLSMHFLDLIIQFVTGTVRLIFRFHNTSGWRINPAGFKRINLISHSGKQLLEHAEVRSTSTAEVPKTYDTEAETITTGSETTTEIEGPGTSYVAEPKCSTAAGPGTRTKNAETDTIEVEIDTAKSETTVKHKNTKGTAAGPDTSTTDHQFSTAAEPETSTTEAETIVAAGPTISTVEKPECSTSAEPASYVTEPDDYSQNVKMEVEEKPIIVKHEEVNYLKREIDEQPEEIIVKKKKRVTIEQSICDLLEEFPKSIRALKNVTASALEDDEVPDKWKMLLISAVAQTTLLEMELERGKQNWEIVKNDL